MMNGDSYIHCEESWFDSLLSLLSLWSLRFNLIIHDPLLSRCCGEENCQPSPAEGFCDCGACQYFSGRVWSFEMFMLSVLVNGLNGSWRISHPILIPIVGQVRCGSQATSRLQRCWLRSHPSPCTPDSSPWPGIGTAQHWTWQTDKVKSGFRGLAGMRLQALRPLCSLMLIHSDNLGLKQSMLEPCLKHIGHRTNNWHLLLGRYELVIPVFTKGLHQSNQLPPPAMLRMGPNGSEWIDSSRFLHRQLSFQSMASWYLVIVLVSPGSAFWDSPPRLVCQSRSGENQRENWEITPRILKRNWRAWGHVLHWI